MKSVWILHVKLIGETCTDTPKIVLLLANLNKVPQTTSGVQKITKLQEPC